MKILSNISWIFFANLIVAFTKWLIIVLLAKLLSPTEVGIYSIAFALSAPITLFANMKLRSLYITDHKPDYQNYIAVRKIMSAFAFIILLTVSFIFYADYVYIIMLVGLSKIFDLQSDMFYALPHKDKNMKLIGKLMILKHVLMLMFFSVCLVLTKDLGFSMLIQICIQILFLYIIEYRSINESYKLNSNKEKYNSRNITVILKLGLPLGLVQMVVSLNTSIPRYLLEFFEDPKTLGYFSAIAYIITIGNMLMNSITQNFIPYLTDRIQKKQYILFKKNVFIHLTVFSLFLGFSLILGSKLLGDVFLEVAYGKDYAAYTDVLILMSVAMAINFISWNLDTALLSMRYISIQPKISIFILILNLIVSYYFIKSVGIYGVAYSFIIINIIQLLIRGYFVDKRLKHLIKNNTFSREL